MRDAFTRDRLNWIERIATDPELSASATRLGVLLATKFLNRRTGDCWPAIATLAALMGVDEKTIRRATSSLVAQGHLTCRRGGKGKPNRYGITFSDRTKTPDEDKPSPDNDVQSTESMTGRFCPDHRTIVSDSEGQKCPPNPLKIEPIEEPIELISEAPKRNGHDKRGIEADFVEFYAQYPRKVARGAARKAYQKARTKVDRATIMAAVHRFSAERAGQDATYTPYPATWLNRESWDDEPAPRSERPLQKVDHELGRNIRRHQSLTDIAINGGDQ